MKVVASPQFLKKVKKFPKQERMDIDAQIHRICDNPALGEEKKQDLKGVFVHKFKLAKREVLVAYASTEDTIYLITIGGHENYYRDLKRYLE